MPLREIASKALERLGVEVCKTQAETDYNRGISNQVRRKIGYDGKFVIFQVVKD